MSQPAPPEVTGLSGFGRGLVAPLRGFGTLLVTPRLWPLASTPVLLSLLFLLGGHEAFGPLGHRFDRWLGHALGAGSRWLGPLQSLTHLLGELLFLVLALLLALVLVPVLAAPFMDRLAARVDAVPDRPEPFLTGLARSVRCALFGLLVFLLPQAALSLLGLLVSPLAPLVAIGVPTVAGLGLAWDALDWPLARRGLGVRARVDWFSRHSALCAGLAVSVSVLGLLPGLPVLLLPWIVLGAVHLLNDVERAEGRVRA